MPDDRSAPVPRSAPPRDPSRPSLREIAERSAAAMPRSQRPGGTAGGVRSPASRPARPRDDDNTGYVEVGELRSLFLASAAKATDPTGGPACEEDASRLASVAPASQASLAYARSEPPARAAHVATKRRASGVVLGAAIALIGIGGSALWVVRTSAARASAGQTAVERGPVAVAAVEPGAPAAPEPAAPAVDDRATAPEAAPAVEPPAAPASAVPTSAGDGVITLALVDVPGTRPPGAPAAGAINPPAAPRANAATAGASRAPASKPSDLAAAIAAAAAGPAAAATPAPVAVAAPPTPAAKAAAPSAGGDAQPSQAAVRASISAVKGAAKACIADADDTSRAQITFAPSGTVTQVVVSGWAADAGVGGCVKNALKAARVEPFSGPPFTVGVTLRP